jgi:hypothetical protein
MIPSSKHKITLEGENKDNTSLPTMIFQEIGFFQ